MKLFKIFTVTCFCLQAFPAVAGFQFTAPVAQQPNQNNSVGGLLPIIEDNAMPAVPSAPVVQQAIIPNVPSQQPTKSPEPLVQSNPAPRQNVLTQTSLQSPVINWNTPTEQTNAPIQSSPNTDNQIAVGFGKDLPLTAAMRQVVPEDYTYILDDGIETGKTVSWNGGQDWRIVMNDMLSPLNLSAEIDNKIIRIKGENSQPILLAKDDIQPPAQSDPISVIEPMPKIEMSKAEPMESLPPIQVAERSKPIPLTTMVTNNEKQTVVPEATKGQWMAQKGSSLQNVIEAWADLEGVDLFWSSEYDYVLAGDANIKGNFEEAIDSLLAGFSQANPKPTGRLHPNLPHGPAVLVIESRNTN